MKNRKIIFEIVIAAMFIALLAIFSYVPYVGFITIGPISFTTIHIIVLIGAMLLGWKHGLIYGFFFGLFSFLQALSTAGTANYLFVNPFVSILPRVIFGFVSGLTFDFLRKRTNGAQFIGIIAISAGLLTLFHTIITLLCLYIFGILDIFKISQFLGLSEVLNNLRDAGFDNFGIFIFGFVSFGCVAEIMAAALIVPIAGGVVFKSFKTSSFTSLGIIKPSTGEIELSKAKLILLFIVASLILLGCMTGLIIHFIQVGELLNLSFHLINLQILL